jgi:hypothetical protein
MGHIERNIGKESSPTDRVAPVIFSLLARGGKTTTLSYLFDELKKSGRYSPILISFNGSSYFQLYEGESKKAAILRLIAAQLCGETAPAKIECDEKASDAYLGDAPVVLLVDELNALQCPLESDAGLLLRKMFLDKRNRFLVFSTHVPMVVDALPLTLGRSQTIPSSDCGYWAVSLPTCFDESKLQSMSNRCGAVTRAEAAYFGGIPSLVYCGRFCTTIWSPDLEGRILL